jgi:hypothetical protein
MIKISHRGNINGKKENLENNPTYIDLAINKMYDVEIDIWYVNNRLYLGHDLPQYSVDLIWLLERKNKFWIHCKNIESLLHLKEMKYDFNYFWHQNDDITLTSKNHFWTYPGKKITNHSIAVLPETIPKWDINGCMGVCSDFIENY